VLPLLQNSRDISIAAIFFAASVTRTKIDDVDGQPWWGLLKGDESNISKAIAVLTQSYHENPLKKTDPRVPGSPEFNLESTRRRGETVASQTEADTPSGTSDRGGTQSPRGAYRASATVAPANGKSEYHDDSNPSLRKEDVPAPTTEIKKEEMDISMTLDISAQPLPPRGDSDAALKAAANDLAIHDSRPAHAGDDSRARSPSGLKRTSMEMTDQDKTEAEQREEPEKKRLRVETGTEEGDDDQDEGEVSPQ